MRDDDPQYTLTARQKRKPAMHTSQALHIVDALHTSISDTDGQSKLTQWRGEQRQAACRIQRIQHEQQKPVDVPASAWRHTVRIPPHCSHSRYLRHAVIDGCQRDSSFLARRDALQS